MTRRLMCLATILCGLLLITGSGCTRAYYRQQADGEVYNLLSHGIRDPRWELNRLTIEADPRSRFFDPDCPDHPPMPPDDPTSHEIMHCVDCKPGWPCWHRNGDKPWVENPDFKDYLPWDEQGNYVVVGKEGAVQLALVNNITYQNNLEELYLSALEVTQQRFAFDMQFFLQNQTFFTAQGRVRGGGRSRSILTTDTQLSAERLFSTGGQLTAELANSFMWQFAGNNTESVHTLLSGAFVQPLLRNAGRDFFLESLTLQERLLLANIRAMQRYRQGFYVQVVTGFFGGVDNPQNPQRRGSGFGGAAAGVFGVTGLTTGGGGGNAGAGGGGATAGAGAAQAGGFLGLLQDARQLENLRANVAGLRRSLQLLEALYEADRIDPLQVELARQSLYNQQSVLLNTEAAYQSSLDNYKLTLGLPPCLNIRINDNMLDQFELLGPEMVQLQNDATTMLAQFVAPPRNPVALAEADKKLQLERDLMMLSNAVELLGAAQASVPGGLNPSHRQRLEELYRNAADLKKAMSSLQSYPAALPQAVALQRAIEETIPDVAESMKILDEQVDDRLETLERLLKREEVQQSKVEKQAFDLTEFKARIAKVKEDFENIQRRMAARSRQWAVRQQQLAEQQAAFADLLERFLQLVNPLRAATDRLQQELAMPAPAARQFLDAVNQLGPDSDVEREARKLQDLLAVILAEAGALSEDASGIGLVQARARLEATHLIPIDMRPCTAFGVAQQNRLDLMNARASVVDAWRLIQVRADALKAGLDVVFDGQLDTLGDNPFRFRSPTGQLRAGLRWDTPITRLTERNVYRQELIFFQRARRNFIAFNDRIDRELRLVLRTIQLNQVNFELRRAAVQVAIKQVELASLRLQEPPRPGVVTALGQTTARDLIDALSALLTAQNAYLSVYVNYEQLRVNLDLALGTMLVDDKGMWIDPGEIDERAYGACPADQSNPDGVPPELLPTPPGNPPVEGITPPDISTLLEAPTEDEAEPLPAPAVLKLRAVEDVKPGPHPEPMRLDPSLTGSARPVPPEPNRHQSTGWKPAGMR